MIQNVEYRRNLNLKLEQSVRNVFFHPNPNQTWGCYSRHWASGLQVVSEITWSLHPVNNKSFTMQFDLINRVLPFSLHFQNFHTKFPIMSGRGFRGRGRGGRGGSSCYSCGDSGHFSRNCPKTGKRGAGDTSSAVEINKRPRTRIDWVEPSQTGSREVYTGTFADRGRCTSLLSKY